MSDSLGLWALPNRSRPQGLRLWKPLREHRPRLSLRRTSTAPWHRLRMTRSRRTRIRTRWRPLAGSGNMFAAVVVVTGRPARTVVRLGRFREVAGLQSMIVLGQYGVERWNAADDEYLIPPDPPQIRAVAEELPKILDPLGLAGARIEDKGRAIAVHTRSLPDSRAALAKLAAPLGDLADRYGLVLGPGKNVWEIRAPGMDKGAALRAIVDETGARQLIFAGDDLGDLPAFQAVRELVTSGVAGLLVCSASTEEDALTELSDVIVDGPSGLAAWLNELAERLGG
jgi:trehalose 6-phosphate phosphatase